MMTKHLCDGGKEKLTGRNLQENQVEIRQYWQVQPDPDKPFLYTNMLVVMLRHYTRGSAKGSTYVMEKVFLKSVIAFISNHHIHPSIHTYIHIVTLVRGLAKYKTLTYS